MRFGKIQKINLKWPNRPNTTTWETLLSTPGCGVHGHMSSEGWLKLIFKRNRETCAMLLGHILIIF